MFGWKFFLFLFLIKKIFFGLELRKKTIKNEEISKFSNHNENFLILFYTKNAIEK